MIHFYQQKIPNLENYQPASINWVGVDITITEATCWTVFLKCHPVSSVAS